MSVPRAAKSTSSTSLAELAGLLARAFLRLAETSRTSAISSAFTEQNPLDESRPESPHVGGNEAA
jgi:hypothetical protein